IPEISSKDYFIHGFALFDKAAKQEVERYTWKTDNYYSNKTGISIADANSITITYNTTTQTEINIRIAKVVSGNCFFSYTDVLYNPNSKEILTNPVRWTHRGRLFNADPNCDYLLVSDPSESEECFNPEFVEAQKARLTGIIDTIDRIKDKDIEPLINSLNGYCSTALGNLGGELLLKAINHIGLMDNIPSDNEKAILRMLEVLPADYYSALITKLSNNEYALLNNLLKEFNDAFLWGLDSYTLLMKFLSKAVTETSLASLSDDNDIESLKQIFYITPVEFESSSVMNSYSIALNKKKHSGIYLSNKVKITAQEQIGYGDPYEGTYGTTWTDIAEEEPVFLDPLTPVIIISDETALPLIQTALDGNEALGNAYVVPAIFLKYANDKEMNHETLRNTMVALDAVTIAASGGAALATKVHWVKRLWAIAETTGAIGDIVIQTTNVSPQMANVVNIFNGAMGLIGLKNLGAGIVKGTYNVAKEIPQAVRALLKENKSIRALIIAKYLEYRIAITQLKNSDDWINLPAETREQIVQQEKTFITLADAKNIPNDTWGAPKSAFINGKTSEDILTISKGSRPLPEIYLDASYIQQHLAKFENGVTKISANPPSGAVGPPNGTFVMPKQQADLLIEQANGNISRLEELLGLEKGTLGNNPVRIDVSNPNGLRMPSGNESGANLLWIPGGQTTGGVLEATIDQIQVDSYSVEFIVK
ncbi:MAG: hypothetical protein LBJ63_08580, partial [Prevotellaceae bacterium]|nr:hypothetical protein [Prevotellaceae bacterium]